MRSVMMRVVVILAAVVLLLIGAFVAWGNTPLGPLPEAEQALLSDTAVSVQQGRWLVFEPANRQADTGLIFYPGGRVDYRSYAPMARELAARGYRVIVVPMPLSLAVLDPNSASEVISSYPDTRYWAIGGHSLGGAMAALFAEQNPEAVQGLVLWAAYPAENNSLADSGLAVVSIYGTEDGLATGGKIDASQSLLPPGTRYVAIQGGNHAQFGWYGEQAGDGQATISPDQQQQQVVMATEGLLQQLKGN